MTIQRSRTDTFEHTVSRLLTKRADLFDEAERIRDRLAEIRNDVGALDRTLNAPGYAGDLDAAIPRQKRNVVSGACGHRNNRELREAGWTGRKTI